MRRSRVSCLPPNVKLVCRDGAVGKTCMLVAYVEDRFPIDYVPTIFETYTTNLIVDGRRVNLSLWDTAGQEDFERLRPLSYSDTDVFIVCYAIPLRSSFENVKAKWIPELNIHEPNVPFIIVGTKVDTRDDNKDPAKEGSFVSRAESEKLLEETGAYSLIECSALQQTNLSEVVEEACKCIFSKKALEIEKREASSSKNPGRVSKTRVANKNSGQREADEVEPEKISPGCTPGCILL